MFSRTVMLFILALSLSSCCSNDAAVAMAYSLSQERLAKLALDIDTLEQKNYFTSSKNIPSEFQDINPTGIRFFGKAVIIHLSGCFDDKALLIVDGVRGNGRKTIELLPGERQEPVLLWQSASDK